METNELKIVQDSLESFNRSEIDMQVSTAKRYPRDLSKCMATIKSLAKMDEETAEDCFYALKRGKGNNAKLIEGLSVRMAEIFASSWGNLRVQTRILGNDGKTITAQGCCHDLETNLAVSVEVKRRITDSNGKTFSDDMVVVTSNAASAIAFRNAIFKVIPKAVTNKVVSDIRTFAKGETNKLESKRQAAIDWFKNQGVTIDEILTYIEKPCIDDLGVEDILTLHSTATAIKEGTTTIEETFRTKPETMEEKKAKLRANTNKPTLL